MNLFAHHISHTHLLTALCQPEEKAHSPNRERERERRKHTDKETDTKEREERGRELYNNSAALVPFTMLVL